MIALIMSIRNLSLRIKNDNINVYSSNAAFFLFLAIVPFLMLLTIFLRYTTITETMLLSIFSDIPSEAISNFFNAIITDIFHKNTATTAVISISAFTALFSASRGMIAVMRGLNSVYHVEEDRNYVQKRAIAVFYTLMLAVILIFVLLLVVFGNVVGGIIIKNAKPLAPLIDFIYNIRMVIVTVILFFFFTIVYKAVPNHKSSLRDQIPGALFTSLGWGLFSFFFSIYIKYFSNYSNIYGSLTTVIIMMLWLYIMVYIMLLGGMLNSLYNPEAETDTLPKAPLLD